MELNGGVDECKLRNPYPSMSDGQCCLQVSDMPPDNPMLVNDTCTDVMRISMYM